MSPRVDAYGTPKVSSTPVPGARLTNAPSVESFGAGLGEQIGGLGLGLYAKQAQQARDQQDQIVVLAAENQRDHWATQRIYDPNQGALTVKGRDSFGLPEQVSAEFDEVTAQLAAGLSNDRQRAAFARTTAARKESLDNDLHRHVYTQMQQVDEQETAAAIENATTDAIEHATEPPVVGQAFNRATTVALQSAQRKGLGREATAALIRDVQTKIHAGVIDGLLTANQDRAAQAYFEETRHQINGATITKLEKELEVGTLQGESQRVSDAILAVAQTDEAALVAVKAITDPKLRDAVQDRVLLGLNLRIKRDQAAHDRDMVQAAGIIEQTKRFEAIPPEIVATMTDRERAGLRSYAKSLQPGGHEVKTDPVLFYRLMRMTSDDPEAFKNLNLVDPVYLNGLGKTERDKLIDTQVSMRKGDSRSTKELAGFRTVDSVFNDTLDQFKIPRTGILADRPEVAHLHKALDDKVFALETLTGKKATSKDVQELMDDLMKSVTTQEGSWWGLFTPGVPLHDVTKRVGDLTVNDIPTAQRQQVIAALRKYGRPVTDESILNTYIAGMRKMGAVK